jgi:hypothetical protein
MPSTQKLAQTIEIMENSLERIKTDRLLLSEIMHEFSRAIDAYKQYSAHVSVDTMDVKEVRIENGKLIEIEYKWQDM